MSTNTCKSVYPYPYDYTTLPVLPRTAIYCDQHIMLEYDNTAPLIYLDPYPSNKIAALIVNAISTNVQGLVHLSLPTATTMYLIACGVRPGLYFFAKFDENAMIWRCYCSTGRKHGYCEHITKIEDAMQNVVA